jgi:hypothetical protein
MSEMNRISDYSFRQGLTLLDERVNDPLAPAIRPMALDSMEAHVLDERAGSRAEREWNDWARGEQQEDPELLLPGAFIESFDLAREEIRQWLVNDQQTQPDNTRALKMCQRVLTEVRANLDLVHYYIHAVFKG